LNEETNINVLFIVIDAVRSDSLGCYGHSQSISPTIDKIARNGVLFKNAFCSINCTEPSLTSMFSGRYPASTGFYKHGERVLKSDVQKLDDLDFLPEILHSLNYKTMAVDWLGRWHSRGYDYYSGGLKGQIRWSLKKYMAKFPQLAIKFIRSLSKQKTIRPDNASRVTNRALKLIENNQNDNWFLFLHYWDTHTPYRPPNKHINKDYLNVREFEEIGTINEKINNQGWRDYFDFRLDGAKNIKDVISKYEGSISYVDSEIGRIVKKLEKLQILDNTLIVITSDHGESLIEHGIYFDHHGLYDETIHVPLVISYPNKLPKNKIVDGFVQHIDLVPTILDIVNCATKDTKLDGFSLLPLIFGTKTKVRNSIFVEEEYTQRKSSIRTDKYKYIYSSSEKSATCKYCGIMHGDLEELYDLKNDAHETNNIIHEKTDEAAALKKELFDWMKHFRNIRTQDKIKKSMRQLKKNRKI